MTDITAAVERLNWFVEGMEESFPSQEPDVRYLWSQRLADIRQLIAAVPQWQPIETAPKDGTVVLLYGEWEAMTDSSRYMAVGTGIHSVFNGWTDDGEGFDAFPTHWMPLPPPPQPKGGE